MSDSGACVTAPAWRMVRMLRCRPASDVDPPAPPGPTLRSWIKRQLLESWHLTKNSWLTFDRRTLGLTRILLGFYLLMDLLRRSAQWEAMFSGRSSRSPTRCARSPTS